MADAKKIKILARKFKGHGKTKGKVQFGEVKVEELPGHLPPATTITSLATKSTDTNFLSLILIHKQLEAEQKLEISIPEGYSFSSGEQLRGDSPLALFDRGKFQGEYNVKNIDALVQEAEQKASLILPPHSMTALLFKKRDLNKSQGSIGPH